MITHNDVPAALEELLSKVNEIAAAVSGQLVPDDKHPAAYLTRKQVCDRLHTSLPTLHSWMRQGRLTAYHIGGRTLFRADEVNSAPRPVNYGLPPRKTKGGAQ